eukprot:SAG31_NODE_57_length_29727_cov_12.584568_21_plen_196_part_00
MGAAASAKYAVRPFSPTSKASPEAASSRTVISLISQSVRHTKQRETRKRHYALTDEMESDVKRIEDEMKVKLSQNWLKAIAAPPTYRLFKDPEQMFLTRPQRLKLEQLAHNAYLKAEQKADRASKPAPYWSIVYTDKGLLEFAETAELSRLGGFKWDGPRSLGENREVRGWHSVMFVCLNHQGLVVLESHQCRRN